MFKKFFKWQSLISLAFITSAMAQSSPSLGNIADTLLISTEGAAKIISSLCLVIGVGLLLTALLKFKAHRDNPEEFSLSAALLIGLLGLAFIALAFLPMPKL